MVYFHEIQQQYYVTEDDPEAILCNLVVSTIPELAVIQTSEVGARLAQVNVGPRHFVLQ